MVDSKKKDMNIEICKPKIYLGKGGFGCVYLGKYDGRLVAVKQVPVDMFNENEKRVLQQLDHRNVVKLYHSQQREIKRKNYVFFAFEYCVASLDKLFLPDDHPNKYRGPRIVHASVVFLQLASGLEYIHAKIENKEAFVHRDIKDENVLIALHPSTYGKSMKVVMKWGDLGLSKPVNQQGSHKQTKPVIGTKFWLAPEVLELINNPNKERGTIKSDVYAEGLVFGYYLLDGVHPFATSSNWRAEWNKVEINMLKRRAVGLDNIKHNVFFYELILEMLEVDDSQRIASSRVVEKLKNSITAKEETLFQMLANVSPIFNSKIKEKMHKIILDCVNQEEMTDAFCDLLQNSILNHLTLLELESFVSILVKLSVNILHHEECNTDFSVVLRILGDFIKENETRKKGTTKKIPTRYQWGTWSFIPTSTHVYIWGMAAILKIKITSGFDMFNFFMDNNAYTFFSSTNVIEEHQDTEAFFAQLVNLKPVDLNTATSQPIEDTITFGNLSCMLDGKQFIIKTTISNNTNCIFLLGENNDEFQFGSINDRTVSKTFKSKNPSNSLNTLPDECLPFKRLPTLLSL